MDKAKCASDNHVWTCKEESGFLNEITKFRSLTPTDITNLKHDPKNEKTICTKGSVVCSRCGEYLNKAQPKTDLSQKFKSLIK
ncbi:hypothetical protein KKF69_08580 [Patescibacteria group bacterium]|nr:hypothetical protein [Patescibacteria group bacterium]